MWWWLKAGFFCGLGWLLANFLFKAALYGWAIFLAGPVKVPGVGV